MYIEYLENLGPNFQVFYKKHVDRTLLMYYNSIVRRAKQLRSVLIILYKERLIMFISHELQAKLFADLISFCDETQVELFNHKKPIVAKQDDESLVFFNKETKRSLFFGFIGLKFLIRDAKANEVIFKFCQNPYEELSSSEMQQVNYGTIVRDFDKISSYKDAKNFLISSFLIFFNTIM